MSIEKKIEDLGESTRINRSYASEIKRAFQLGLWCSEIPEFCVDLLENRFTWYEPEAAFEVKFNSDTTTSWHEFYRLWRASGWERISAERTGGLITYLMSKTDRTKPDGYQTLRVVLLITLSTCKLVSKGFKQVEEFETICEDLIEPSEDAE
jgi:hypothetical protein